MTRTNKRSSIAFSDGSTRSRLGAACFNALALEQLVCHCVGETHVFHDQRRHETRPKPGTFANRSEAAMQGSTSRRLVFFNGGVRRVTAHSRSVTLQIARRPATSPPQFAVSTVVAGGQRSISAPTSTTCSGGRRK